MSNSSSENKLVTEVTEHEETSSVSSDHCRLPQVTVLQASDVPKASPEALHLLKTIGK